MFYRLVGVMTGLATIGFIGGVVVTTLGSAPTRENTMLFAMSASIVAVGLLITIWHLNIRQASESIRAEWRGYLAYLGPLAATAYLLQIAPQSPTDVPRRLFPKLLLAVGLGIMGLVITLLAAYNLAPIETLSPIEAFTNYGIRLGGIVAVAVIGSSLGLRYWRALFWILLPSFIALYASVSAQIELAMAMLAAALFLSVVPTSVSRLMAR